MANYEILSAKEASINSIFFDKNTKRLSYKNKYGIITILAEGNITAPVVSVNNYSEFYNLLTTEELIPGTWYSVPYKSVNFLNGWTTAQNNPISAYPSFDPREIYTGDQEVLLVQAVSNSSISPIGYSESHPQDVIEYAPYTNKIGLDVNIYNGNNLPDSSTVSGFDIQWDGSNAYIQMPAGYPALFGHYFYLYAEFASLSAVDTVSLDSGAVSTGDGIAYTVSGNNITGVGSGASFTIKNAGGGYVFEFISSSGSDYQIGDQILILGSNLGGVDGVNDLIITVDSLGYYFYYQDGCFEPITPGVVTCQYPYTSNDPDYGYTKKVSKIKVVDNGEKVLLLDLTEQDVINYLVDSLSVQTVYAIGDAYGWITRRKNIEKNINVPFDFRGRKYRRYKTEIFGSLQDISYSSPGTTATDGIYHNIPATAVINGTVGSSASFTVVVNGGSVTSVTVAHPGFFYGSDTEFLIDGTAIGGVTSDDDIAIYVTQIVSNISYSIIGNYYNATGYSTQTTLDEYKDFKCFEVDAYDCFDIEWSGMGGPDVYWYTGYSDNNVFQGFFSDNKLGDFSINNTAIGDVSRNNFKSLMSYNIILNSQKNSIGHYFSYNIFDGDNNIIGNDFTINVAIGTMSYNIIGSYCYFNLFSSFTGNSVGDNFSYNVFNFNAFYNTIKNNFFGNLIQRYFSSNVIGVDFQYNVIGEHFSHNVIGNNFYNNEIGEGFGFGGGSSRGNTIGNYFHYNNIGEYFYDNRIADVFSYNVIKDYFQFNDVKVSILSTDFSAATHVYGDYNCDIFKNSGSILRLSYYDGLDVLVIDDIDN